MIALGISGAGAASDGNTVQGIPSKREATGVKGVNGDNTLKKNFSVSLASSPVSAKFFKISVECMS